METVKITPDGKRIIIIDLTVSPPEVKRARKVPRAAAPEALSAPTARIFAPLDPVPAPSPDPDDDWRYSIPEAESSVVDVHARNKKCYEIIKIHLLPQSCNDIRTKMVTTFTIPAS